MCQRLNVAGYQVPPVLSELLNPHPLVKRWFIDELGVADLNDSAPRVVQLHEAPSITSPEVAKYLEDLFNNPDAYPDAVFALGSQELHVHRHIVATGSEVLARELGMVFWWQGDCAGREQLSQLRGLQH